MSLANQTETHAHDAHHAAGGHDAGSHGSKKAYLVGFALSAILTAIPFWLVMTGAIADARTAGFVVTAFAFAQIIVHTICFLHVNTRSEGGWTLMALMFTGVMIVLVISGSLWIMYHLNSNMMPMSPEMTQSGMTQSGMAQGGMTQGEK